MKGYLIVELSGRKKDILLSIINLYIESGEPVSSKALSAYMDLGLSPATLRNEMSELCEMGYLEQPHTSAGRVPTSLGLKVYVNRLINKIELPYKLRLIIDSGLEEAASKPDRIPSIASQILADITGLPSLFTTQSNKSAFIKKLEFLPMSKKALLIVLITSDGTAKSRIIRTNMDLTHAVYERLENIINNDIIGEELAEFSQAFMQGLVAGTGEFGFPLLPILSAILEMINEIQESQININGESKLFDYFSNYKEVQSVKQLARLISEREAILSIIESLTKPIDVIFGEETSIDALKPSSMVVAKYKAGNKELGRLGVIGPTRMAYKQVIPSIEYLASRLSHLLTQAMKDMED
ncbi:MAG TPA: heat-inducible transcription repressor HrcA [Clostridiales bacterium]|nr:heat-inducible transcription repressor HrcA [Clostridiales bacterium]